MCIFFFSQIIAEIFFREQGEEINYATRTLDLSEAITYSWKGKTCTFCRAFLFFWCKAGRVTTRKQERVAKVDGKKIPREKKKNRGFEIQPTPKIEVLIYYFNFTFWDVLFA